MDQYLNHWGLSQPVFNRALPFGRIFCPSKRQKDLQRLLQLARQPKTVQLVTAPPGHGKSCVAHWLYSSLDPLNHEPFLGIALDSQKRGPSNLVSALNEFLIGKASLAGQAWRATAKGLEQLAEENRSLVLLVEAVAPAVSLWQELAVLLELSANARAATSILIFGEGPLAESVAVVGSLQERLAFHWTLPSFERDECDQYVKWYLDEAGLARNPFDEGALRALHLYSQGIAARINSLGETCLMEAAFEGQRGIDRALVEQVAKLRQKTPLVGTPAPTPTGSEGGDDSKRGETFGDTPTRGRGSLFRDHK